MASNVYRRGAIYWWRRHFTFRNPDPHPITLRMSLRTAAPDEARARGAVLEAMVEEVRLTMRAVPTVEDFKAIARRAFERALERYTLAQLSFPQVSEQHARANLGYARYFALIADSPQSVRAAEPFRHELRSRGLSEAEIDQLWMIALTHEERSAVSHRLLFDDLQAVGVKPTEKNAQMILRSVAAAYSQACIQATEAMGLPSPASQVFPLPPALRSLFPAYECPTNGVANPSPQPTATPPVVAKTSSQPAAPHPLTTEPAAPGPALRPKKTLRDAFSEYRAKCLARGSWSEGTARQASTSIELFDFACGGDAFIEDITQSHVRRLGELFRTLPNRWGRTKEEAEGGLLASLERAKPMSVDMLGLGPPTVRKHLVYIEGVLNDAKSDIEIDGNGHRPAERISFDKLKQDLGADHKKKGRKRARDLRSAWTCEEIGRLLAAPVWTGSQDLDNRWEPGGEVFHDAWYWLPLKYDIDFPVVRAAEAA